MAAVSSPQGQSVGSHAFDKVEPHLSPPTLFDPAQHLCFEPPKESVMLKDLGLSEEGAIAPLAISAPFPLFTLECVRRLREEMFTKKIVNEYSMRMEPGCYTLRGFVDHAPFLGSVWRSKEVLDACSKAAGVDLNVIFDYEMGHINVQIEGLTDDTPLESMLPPAMPPPHKSSTATEVESLASAQEQQLSAAGPWHKDCYPWVIVIMLSDPADMIGGETGLRKSDGTVVKYRGPGVGWAVMMQGGCVEHIALKSLGGERIAMVTSFCPKDPMQLDLSHLDGVRNNSDWSPLYKQWSLYRLDVLERRIAVLREKLQNEDMSYEEISRVVHAWTDGVFKYMEHTAAQLK